MGHFNLNFPSTLLAITSLDLVSNKPNTKSAAELEFCRVNQSSSLPGVWEVGGLSGAQILWWLPAIKATVDSVLSSSALKHQTCLSFYMAELRNVKRLFYPMAGYD